MNDHDHHDEFMRDVAKELDEILEESEQGVYVYLDDGHKLCNARFATLLGYPSPEAWAAVDEPFPMVFVAPESRETLIAAYQDAMDRLAGSSSRVTWRTLSGGTVDTDVILDYLLARPDFYPTANAIWKANREQTFEGFVSAITPANVFYVARKLKSAEIARNLVADMISIWRICPVDDSVL